MITLVPDALYLHDGRMMRTVARFRVAFPLAWKDLWDNGPVDRTATTVVVAVFA